MCSLKVLETLSKGQHKLSCSAIMYPTLRRPLFFACRFSLNKAYVIGLSNVKLFFRVTNYTPQRFFTSAQPSSGFITFKLADIGEGITEVELLNWCLKEGDHIEEMGDVCVVQSDKSAVEISSPLTGSVVKLHHNVGDIIKIGSPLMDVNVEGVAETKPIAKGKDTQTEERDTGESLSHLSESQTPVPNNKIEMESKSLQEKEKRWRASPAVRALARKHQVDLSAVRGTGSSNTITQEDILNYIKDKKNDTITPADTSPPRRPPAARVSKEKTTSDATQSLSASKDYEEILLTSPVSKGMVKSMNQSLTIPYMSLQEDIDITDLLNARLQLNQFLKSAGLDEKLTVTSIMIKAVSTALTMVPILNSKFDATTMDRYKLYHNHNISLAIDTPHGLVVPNIKHVEKLSLRNVQKQVTELSSLAKNNRLTLQHLTGGTITISNVGVIGSTAVRPIVFDGQACILGIGRTQKLPRYHNTTNVLEPRYIVNITASVDHRHIDGATVARFIKTLRDVLENMQILSL